VAPRTIKQPLERHSRKHLSVVLATIEAPDASADPIRMAFTGYASAGDGGFRGRGCSMCNTAVERGALDPGAGGPSLPTWSGSLGRSGTPSAMHSVLSRSTGPPTSASWRPSSPRR
jgi:hypothetical protein